MVSRELEIDPVTVLQEIRVLEEARPTPGELRGLTGEVLGG